MEVFKAPKITNSHSFNHIKNDEVTGISSTIPVNNENNKKQSKSNETQFQKSAYPSQPQQQRLADEEELRNTWKHGPPKINSNKLPPAFSNAVGGKSRQQKVQPLVGGNKNINVKVSQEIQISKLENYEAMQEYKQANQMLSPLKKVSKKKKQQLFFLKRDNSTNKQQANSVPSGNQSKNPLAPLKHFMKNQQKINEELGMNMSELNQKNDIVQQNGLLQGSIKMEEMITTDVIRSYADQSPVKKMLHAPTLKIYIVKEEPLQNKEIRKNIKEWISFWQTKIGSSTLHVKVYSTFWNSPEGYVSIVMEHLNGGSLQNLFESVGYLPEKAIKQIALPVLSGLQKIHQNGPFCHGALAPSQILFTREGQVKLSLGISYRIQMQSNQIFTSYLLGKNKDYQSLYEPNIFETPSLWNKGSTDRVTLNQGMEGFSFEKSNDVWKLGLLLLNCAIGTLEFHPKAQILYEGFKLILEEGFKQAEQLKDHCCVIHSEAALINLIENIKGSSDTKVSHIIINIFFKENKLNLSILDVLSNGKFSSEFISFLCAFLKIDPRKRLTVDQALLHPFLGNKHEPKGPRVTLKELIQISSNWNNSLPEEYQGQSEKKLDRIADALNIVLPNCEKTQIPKNLVTEENLVMKYRNIFKIIQIKKENWLMKWAQVLKPLLKGFFQFLI